jgi:hypothetical protein
MLTKDEMDFVLGLIDRHQKENSRPLANPIDSKIDYQPTITEQFLNLYLSKATIYDTNDIRALPFNDEEDD